MKRAAAKNLWQGGSGMTKLTLFRSGVASFKGTFNWQFSDT